MRDQFAPMIEGFDLNGIVDPYSFQCTPFYIEGDNGGTLMDGTTIHDILEEKVRLSWTFNALYIDRYTALSDALNSGESPDTVTAYAYDLTQNVVILAKFHASLPEFNFVSAYGQTMCISNGELVLEEAELIAWFSVTPPDRNTYGRGETLDLTRLTVMRYDKDGNGVDITAQCNISTVDEVELLTEGDMAVPVLITLPSGFELIFDWNVAVMPIVARGSWWTLFKNGLLDIYCIGNMPNYNRSIAGLSTAPWDDYRRAFTTITFSNSVTSIGDYAFYSNYLPQYDSLIRVTIPNSVTSIGDYAFGGSTHLSNVTIPNSVTTIGACAFAKCRLTSMTIPDSVTTIGERAFDECGALTGVTIGNGVTTIEYRTFANCRSLSNVTIPNSVTSIGDYAFYNCDSLTSVTIPDSVTTIGAHAFNDCERLTSVTIPDSVTSIGDYAFDYCMALTSVTIGNGVTTIEHHTFAWCRSLTSVTIPDSVTSIEDHAFDASTLTHVYYSGTEEQRNAISIGSYNTSLTDATWHYNSTGPDSGTEGAV